MSRSRHIYDSYHCVSSYKAALRAKRKRQVDITTLENPLGNFALPQNIPLKAWHMIRSQIGSTSNWRLYYRPDTWKHWRGYQILNNWEIHIVGHCGYCIPSPGSCDRHPSCSAAYTLEIGSLICNIVIACNICEPNIEAFNIISHNCKRKLVWDWNLLLLNKINLGICRPIWNFPQEK